MIKRSEPSKIDRTRGGSRRGLGTVSQLRVSSGQLKGLTLASPEHSATHPMGQREKIALFNMIRPQLAHAKVLDLYAGSGALGIEACSNGAVQAVFVENHPRALQALAENVERAQQRLDRSVSLGVYRGKVEQFLAQTSLQFDLIVADPPYDDFRPEVLANIVELLEREGMFVLSFPAQQAAPSFSGLVLVNERHYAGAKIAIYRRAI